jgi:hypothetical protein
MTQYLEALSGSADCEITKVQFAVKYDAVTVPVGTVPL